MLFTKEQLLLKALRLRIITLFQKKNCLSKYIFKKHKNFLCVKKIESLLKIYSFNSVCLLLLAIGNKYCFLEVNKFAFFLTERQCSGQMRRIF